MKMSDKLQLGYVSGPICHVSETVEKSNKPTKKEANNQQTK